MEKDFRGDRISDPVFHQQQLKNAKTVTVKGKTSRVIKNLKKGKTYYVRVRTYKTVDKVKYYSGWCGKKKVKIRKK